LINLDGNQQLISSTSSIMWIFFYFVHITADHVYPWSNMVRCHNTNYINCFGKGQSNKTKFYLKWPIFDKIKQDSIIHSFNKFDSIHLKNFVKLKNSFCTLHWRPCLSMVKHGQHHTVQHKKTLTHWLLWFCSDKIKTKSWYSMFDHLSF